MGIMTRLPPDEIIESAYRHLIDWPNDRDEQQWACNIVSGNLMFHLQAREYRAIDAAVRMLRINEMPMRLVYLVLQISHPIQEQLPSWQPTVNKFLAHMKKIEPDLRFRSLEPASKS